MTTLTLPLGNVQSKLPNASSDFSDDFSSISELSPTDLHHQFVKLFHERRAITNKMMGLLPQIEKSGIYEKYGCVNIFEYAFKFGKFSKALTLKALRTWKGTEDKPYLQKLIEKQGVHKVAMVMNLATPKTEKVFAEHVENMSKPALQEFVKELRKSSDGEAQQKCHCVPTKMTIELDSETQILFNQLKHQHARNLSNQQALRVLLEKLKESENPKTKTATRSQKTDVPGDVFIENLNNSPSTEKPPKIQKPSTKLRPPILGRLKSKNIPTKIKQKIAAQTAGKCAYPNCTRAIENFHHRTQTAHQLNHDSAIGLCKIHHEFAHNGIIRNELKKPENWQIAIAPKKTAFDSKYLTVKNRWT